MVAIQKGNFKAARMLLKLALPITIATESFISSSL